MGREEDEWVKSAMTDDSIVAELLIRFKNLEESSSMVDLTPLKWGVRQRRSRQILRCNNIVLQGKKEGELTRASPTTPLSWSGGTSFSGGGVDCYEESSRPIKRLNGVRSKVTATGEAANRKSRKKKTFAELKEEESLFLEENMQLKKELATLRSICQEQRDRNERLKKRKLDLQVQSASQRGASNVTKETFGQSCQADVDQTPTTGGTCHELDAVVNSTSQPSKSCEMQEKDGMDRDSFFALPDLNLPIEEESSSEDLYGMS